MQGGGGSLLSGKSNATVSPQASVWMALSAFTMAEILLSLTIIGVVAAITLPRLTGNINERTWNTQRKALYARFSQAIALMPALNGYGTLVEGTDSTSAQDTAAETFITAGLSKVLKINNICDNEHLQDCGIASKITTLGAQTLTTPNTMSGLNSYMTMSMSIANHSTSLINTKAAAFETANGESILVFYNPYCIGDLNDLNWGGADGYYTQNKVCANFIYDLNGNKGPNTVGKDIGFMTAMYPSDAAIAAPIMAQNPLSETYLWTEASAACTAQDNESRLPNVDEAISMFVNMNLLTGQNSGLSGRYWWTSKSVFAAGTVRYIFLDMARENAVGQIDDRGAHQNLQHSIWCVKR